MTNQFFFTESVIVFHFDRNTEIRRKLREFERALVEIDEPLFEEFIVIPVPKDMNKEIPRFQSQSKSKHSILQVSQANLVFRTRFDENFKSDGNQVSDYLNSRLLPIYSLISSEKIYRATFLLKLIFPCSENDYYHLFNEIGGVKAYQQSSQSFKMQYSLPYLNEYILAITSGRAKYRTFEAESAADVDEFLESSAKEPDDAPSTPAISIDVNLATFNRDDSQVIIDQKFVSSSMEVLFNLIQKSSLESYVSGSVK